MHKNINVWGREFKLEVIFDSFKDEEVLTEQLKALVAFLDKAPELLSDVSAVEKYCVDNSNGKVSAPIDNIFKYVIPTQIFVVRSKAKREVVLLCNYKFDDEAGCAIVFENEALKRICTQEDI